MITRAPPIVALSLACCAAPAQRPSGPGPAPAPVTARALAQPVSVSSDAAPVPATVARLPEVREPTSAACRLSSEAWWFDELRLSVKGARFARVAGARVSVVLPIVERVSDTSEAIALFDGGANLRLVVGAHDLALYMRAPRPMLGVLTPDGAAELAFTAGATDAVRVSFVADEVLASPSPVTDTLRCAELAVDPSEFVARSSLTTKKKLTQRWIAREGAPIAAVRGGATVATLRASATVGVLETRGSETRILAEGPRYVVSGWVANKDLSANVMLSSGYGFGSGGLAGYSAALGNYPTCAHDLTLIGEVGSERAVIGAIPSGSSFRLVADPAAPLADGRGRADLTRLVPVELPQSVWLRLEKNARLLVRASELEACAAR